MRAAEATIYPTLGNPTTAIATEDRQYVFVSVTDVGSPNFLGPDSVANARRDVVSGLQIFRNHDGVLQPYRFLPLGTPGANGLALLPDGKTIVVGAGDAGVAFVNVQDAIHGIAVPYFAPQGKGAGTFDVVVTPNGKYVFSSNEYGMLGRSRGNIGIIAVHAAPNGLVTHPETIGAVATGDVVPSLALSPDGRRLYVASELVPADNPAGIAGVGNPILTKHDCIQRKGTPPRSNGFITVIDVRRAVDPDLRKSAILARISSGCSPVRLDETPDETTLFVTARGDNRVLAFDPQLLVSDSRHALRYAFDSNGTAPVGIRVFAHGRKLAVANSNRFAEGVGTAAIFNLSKSKPPTLARVIPAGTFPRNLTLGAKGHLLYLTNYGSRTLQLIRINP